MGQLDYLIYYEQRKKAEAQEREKQKIKTYASERYNPTIPYCSGGISLKFDGEFLYLFSGDFTDKYKADSGIPDGKGNFDYGVQRQQSADVGPIPEGKYWINPDEFWVRDGWKFFLKDSYGNYRITIHPFADTQTYGSKGPATGLFIPRGGFFIHGGTKRGSKGCIDLTGSMDKFFDDVKRLIGENSKCQIHLSVKYQ